MKKQEVDLAEQFAKALLKPFRPEQFHDEYSRRVLEMIESKDKGKPGPQPEKVQHLAPVIDLMSALKKSLADTAKSDAAKPKKMRKKVARLIREKYSGDVGTRFGPTLAAEHLAREDQIELSASTVRGWMLAEGLWSRARKTGSPPKSVIEVEGF